jgi:hypothetical protein
MQANKRPLLGAVVLALSVLTLSGCASAPPAPSDAMQAAQLAIARAEEARIPDYDSPDLRNARDKLTRARAAIQAEDMVGARRLAEEARVDAEAAAAKAGSARAQAVNLEMQRGIDALQQEMQRKSGGQ